MIKEYLVKKALDAAMDVVAKIVRESGSKIATERGDIEESINHHLRSVNNWSGEVSFSDLKRAKRTSDIFIELDLLVYPSRVRINDDELIESVPLTSILDGPAKHFILLGQPGAGKTTSMKNLCQKLFQDEGFHTDRFSFPVVISLKDLNNAKNSADSAIIIDHLFNILGLKITMPANLSGGARASERVAIKEKVVINVLEALNVLLILDGFDELTKAAKRDDAIKQIRNLATHLDNSTMIVTSRTGDFNYNVDNAMPYEISPLTEIQIRAFAAKWLNDESAASDFLKQVYESPFADTTIRPLTLAHLCAIYERVGRVPEKPKTVYRKIVNLLLEEWDEQRSVKRQSRYAQFEVDRKFEFLCQLAYVLTTSLGRTVFSKDDLLEVFAAIHDDYNLKKKEATLVVGELESHTGLLLQSGYDQFEFAHKSLQEYLSAEYLVKLPSIPSDARTLARLPNELAIAVTISSRPSEYFSQLVTRRMTKLKLSAAFARAFLSRLLLEKPDFNSSTMLGLSLLILYSLYLEHNVVGGGMQLSLFYVDGIISEFESVLTVVLRRSSIDFVQSHYETDFTYQMDDGGPVNRMVKRRGNPAKLPAPLIDSDLPRILYIRSSLLV